MASLRQIEANRRNAAKSTGPKSPEGKARSSKNALYHGLTSEDLVIQGEESEEDLNALIQDWFSHYKPVGALEAHYVRLIAISNWRLQRMMRMETGYLDLKIEKTNSDDFEPAPGDERIMSNRLIGLSAINSFSATNGYSNFNRHEARLQRTLERAIVGLHQLQAIRMARQSVENTQPAALPSPEKHFLQNEPNPKIGQLPAASVTLQTTPRDRASQPVKNTSAPTLRLPQPRERLE